MDIDQQVMVLQATADHIGTLNAKKMTTREVNDLFTLVAKLLRTTAKNKQEQGQKMAELNELLRAQGERIKDFEGMLQQLRAERFPRGPK